MAKSPCESMLRARWYAALGSTVFVVFGVLSCLFAIPAIASFSVSPLLVALPLIVMIPASVIAWVLYLQTYIDWRIEKALGKGSDDSIVIEEREGRISRYARVVK